MTLSSPKTHHNKWKLHVTGRGWGFFLVFFSIQKQSNFIIRLVKHVHCPGRSMCCTTQQKADKLIMTCFLFFKTLNALLKICICKTSPTHYITVQSLRILNTVKCKRELSEPDAKQTVCPVIAPWAMWLTCWLTAMLSQHRKAKTNPLKMKYKVTKNVVCICRILDILLVIQCLNIRPKWCVTPQWQDRFGWWGEG